MNIEEFLKTNLNTEKEAWAVAEALENLTQRGEDAAPLREEFAHDLAAIEERTLKVASMVAAVPNAEIRQVLSGRYLHKMSWDEIAANTFSSKSKVQRLHHKGIEWLEKHY